VLRHGRFSFGAALSVRIKICGVRRAVDVAACAAVGVDAIGFNCWPGSPRYLAPGAAADLIAQVPSSILPVGVFVKASPEEVERTVAIAGFRAVQLHGDEDPSCYAHLSVEIIQVVRIRDPASLPTRPAHPCVARVLLDAHVAQFGGAGRSFDWTLVPMARGRLGREVLIGGGLTPANVLEAIRVGQPWGVDVASGVESSPGVKDPQKMQAFVAAVRAAQGDSSR
jgi:phosphoribosylanthranilate isomerase